MSMDTTPAPQEGVEKARSVLEGLLSDWEHNPRGIDYKAIDAFADAIRAEFRAALDEARAEAEQATALADQLGETANREYERAERAEAEVARLREALEYIAGSDEDTYLSTIQTIAWALDNHGYTDRDSRQ